MSVPQTGFNSRAQIAAWVAAKELIIRFTTSGVTPTARPQQIIGPRSVWGKVQVQYDVV